jgi:hypothetical protein
MMLHEIINVKLQCVFHKISLYQASAFLHAQLHLLMKVKNYLQIRASAEDLEKERGAVLEELRGGRNAMGRIQEAHWMLMMKGSQVCGPANCKLLLCSCHKNAA